MKTWFFMIVALAIFSLATQNAGAQGTVDVTPEPEANEWIDLSVAMPITFKDGNMTFTEGLALMNTIPMPTLESLGIIVGGGLMMEKMSLSDTGKNDKVIVKPMLAIGYEWDAGKVTMGVSRYTGNDPGYEGSRDSYHISLGIGTDKIADFMASGMR